jgi:glycosyltransferase involved in cell wall biosynthesis
LTLAGQDKGLLGETRSLAAAMGLNGAVRFAGFLDAEGKRREFAGHDVFLNTNRVDNAPVSVLEAAACGLPVVSTAVGGIPYLLRNEEEALLVPEGDAAAMAGAVRRLLDRPDLAGRLSAAGRQVAERSAWERVRPAWEDVLRRGEAA